MPKKKKPPDRRLVLTMKGKFVLFALKHGMTYDQAKEEWKHINSKEAFDPHGKLRHVFEEVSDRAAENEQSNIPPA